MLKCPQNEKHTLFRREETWYCSTTAYYDKTERLEYSGEIVESEVDYGEFHCATCNATAIENEAKS